ncbi:hypothetical protein BGW36DRAFT_430414 [Talaromyces proteolyticus]|uniref:WKF domain-containing protein n=1 Tax=Talaromyces proteolyticus TaxID=1131652 RepID=A0AAD4KIS1_9EURO|nr:uncharacterized protein BGW36DRAFT_430414 [Talaromyces proteolyticus]KAH8692659.1 hypothetical protein BGW36DRAFT_430414 [Talaromyces proteolyticus]
MSQETTSKDRKNKNENKEKKSKKQKRVLDNDDGELVTTVEVKKTKKSKKRRLDDDDEHYEHDEGKMESKKLKKSQRRKSVSFADDTKEVGTSEEDASSEPATATQNQDGAQGKIETEDVEEEISPEVRKQRKREKREQRRKKDIGESEMVSRKTPTPNSTDETPVLSYLSQYSENRSEWKFQKNRESQLLKKILSLDDVPAEYNRALFVYLKGLKSEGARQRLRKNAQEGIKSDEVQEQVEQGEDSAADTGSTSIPDSSKESYNEAVRRFKGNLNAGAKNFDDGVALEDADPDLKQRLEKRKRAELVLWSVSGKISKNDAGSTKPRAALENIDEEASSAKDKGKEGNQNKKAPARKKRKNRTMLVEISSSSESDSD